MPELPEVEVTRLSFALAIAGAQVVDARLGLPLREFRATSIARL